MVAKTYQFFPCWKKNINGLLNVFQFAWKKKQKGRLRKFYLKRANFHKTENFNYQRQKDLTTKEPRNFHFLCKIWILRLRRNLFKSLLWSKKKEEILQIYGHVQTRFFMKSLDASFQIAKFAGDKSFWKK